MSDTIDATRAAAFDPSMAGALGSNTSRPGWDLATERRIDDGRSLLWLGVALGLATLALVFARRLVQDRSQH